MKRYLKIYLIFFWIFFLVINIYSKDKKNGPEKYYNIAIKYYLEGDFDNAINILTRALQIDKDNIRYSALYDMILDEKEKLKIIKLDKKQNDIITENYIDYDELIKKLKNYIKVKEEQQNKRILNLINAISVENTEIKKYQTEVLDKKITDNESKFIKLTKDFKILILFVILILLILLILITFFIIVFKRMAKIKEKIELISLKQNEQHMNLLKLEDEQKKLQSKIQ